METVILFDPTVEKLQSIIAETAKITAEDLSDDAQLAVVKGTRLQLRDARVTIEKQGKEMRTEALKYQKDVIAREKELIGIIEPEEIRLKAIEEQATQMRERAARAALLPMRQEMLAKFGEPLLTDESILDMDNEAFMVYLNERQAQKNEADRIDIEAEKARLTHEALLAQVKKDAEVAERNRIEEAAKADEARRIQVEAQKKYDAELAAQKLIDDAKAEVARIVAEADAKVKAEEDAKSAAEAAQVEAQKDQKYINWLESIGYDPEQEDLWIIKEGKAYKFVGEFV